MASSSYYKGLMTQYSNAKKDLEAKKVKWEEYKEKLSGLKGKLASSSATVSSCSSSLIGGGYLIGEGLSLDNGRLAEIASDFDNKCSSIGNIITKMDSKIQEFATRITELTNLYNTAYTNYLTAKQKENAENGFSYTVNWTRGW